MREVIYNGMEIEWLHVDKKDVETFLKVQWKFSLSQFSRYFLYYNFYIKI